MAICDLQLILSAARCAYRVGPNKIIYDERMGEYKLAETVNPSKKEGYQETLNSVKEQGYSIHKDISPEGGGYTNLAGAVLVPDDDTSPIVIAYRGTSTSKDVWADFRLGLGGVVGKSFREQAYKFYLQVKRNYPDREIVLSGHSLGGHLAQYVGAKAYAEDVGLRKKQSLYVRTFNTAPISTRHKKSLNKHRSVFNNFINYRLAKDVISDLPIKEYYGNVFDIQYDKYFYDSHSLNAVDEALPDRIKKQRIGRSETQSALNNRVIESIRGIIESYRCRVGSQWFPGLSQFINVQLLNRVEEIITSHLDDADYFKAKFALGKLNKLVRGKRIKELVDLMFNMVCKAEQEDPNVYSFALYTSKIQDLIKQLNVLEETSEGEEYNILALHLLDQIKKCDQDYIESQGLHLNAQVLFTNQGQCEQGELSDTASNSMRNTREYTSGVLLDPQSKLKIAVSPMLGAKQTACRLIPKDTKADLRVETVLSEKSSLPSWKTPIKYIFYKLSSWFYGTGSDFELINNKQNEVDELLKNYQADQNEFIDFAEPINESKREEAMQTLINDSLSMHKDTWLFGDSKSFTSFFRNNFKNKASFEPGETRRLYQVGEAKESCYYSPPYHLVIDQRSGKWRASYTPATHQFVRKNAASFRPQERNPEVQSTTKILLSSGIESEEKEELLSNLQTPSVELWSQGKTKNTGKKVDSENSEEINFQL